MNNTYINVADMAVAEWSTGPGRFLTIWVQGCLQNCKGCINKEYQPMVIRHQFSVQEITARLGPDLAGVCFTGGEPFLQAKALGELANAARDRGLGVVSYSGYTLEGLGSGQVPDAETLLDQLDILIDGPYVESQADVLLWRGSRNQRIHLFTERYPVEVLDHPPVTSLRLNTESAVTVGTPNPALDLMLGELRTMGITLNDTS